ncbi:MAG TPA: hypothetical protein VI168_15490, partial [Croceibacterium sp.]
MSASDAAAGRRFRPTALAAGPAPWTCRHFAGLARLAVAAALASVPAAGLAQSDERPLAGMLRECRGLADASARMACYDRIPLDAPEQRTAAVPQAPARAEQRADAGFGANQLPRPAAQAGPERISARVAHAVERQPGIYLLTLADGTEWEFVDSAPAAYDPPRAGSTVEIVAASLGSYLVRYAGQRAV